jgi:branched-subunit amino acid ABC-type transport system permease component
VPSPFQLKDVVTFLILILVLLFRPGGILGTGEAEKV